MTRKDYINIALAIASVRASYQPNWDANLFRALNDVANQLASIIASDNPRFDCQRFLTTCGV